MRTSRQLSIVGAAALALLLPACGGGGSSGDTSSSEAASASTDGSTDASTAATDGSASSASPTESTGATESTGSDGTTASTGSGDGVLVYAAVFAQATLDPDLLPISQMATYTAPIYDSLTMLDGNGDVQPLLATEWSFGSDGDGDYVDITLREGATFGDGTPFTADTVVANIDRSQNMEKSTTAGNLRGVTVEKTDDTHVRFRNPNGVGAITHQLAGPAGMMISDKAIADKTDLTATGAGIGPFLLDSADPNRVVYKRNPDYWDPSAAAVETLEIQYLADDAKVNAIRAGDIDLTIVPEKLTSTAEDSGYQIDRSLGSENYTFSFNTAIAPFDNPDVRQAVNMAIDRQAICDGIFEGACEPTGQFFGAGNKEYDPDIGLTNFPYDLEKAKQMIADAGAAGAKVEIVTVAGNIVFEQLATVFQAQLNEIGLDASVSPLAPPQVVAAFGIDKTAPIAFGATGNNFDPSESINRYLMPTGIYNPGGYEDAELVTMATQAVIETDPAKRTELYRQLSGKLMPTSPIVPLLTPSTAYVIGPDVSGWQNPWAPSFPSFRGVSG